jgi:hypothetical protein
MKNSSRTLATWILAVTGPLVAGVIFYLAADPFCVLRRPLYVPTHPVAINRDYASTELYLRQQPAHDYDSFVFGNSRSTAFRCPEWLAAAGRPDGRCFHFDAWKESLFGVEAKVRLVDQLAHQLHDVLIVLDGALLAEVTPSTEPAYRSHPRLVEQSWIGFQADYLVDFFSNHFVIKYADYAASGKVRGYMGAAFNARNFTHLLDSNDEIFTAVDERIARQGEAFWQRPEVFGARTGGTAPLAVLEPQRRLLASMKSVFVRRGTRVRIVVSPLYDQIRLHPDDVATLRAFFGADAVADFSGENPLTADVHNYYESSHYRPGVARQILASLYRSP